MNCKRYDNDSDNHLKDSALDHHAGDHQRTEGGDRTEIEQPNPSIATPGIPAEMPAREIR